MVLPFEACLPFQILPGLAFTPPSRKDGHRTPSVKGGFKWTPGPTNSPPSPSQTSVTHLLEAGLICRLDASCRGGSADVYKDGSYFDRKASSG